MGYESTIHFTLDTICPWTCIARKRLSIALERVRATNPPVTFHIRYHPYQLHPEAPAPPSGEDKHDWYLKNMFQGSESELQKYVDQMTRLFASCEMSFRFGGELSNSLHAHRVMQHFQGDAEEEPGAGKGEETADGILDELYRLYFACGYAPAAQAALLEATEAAGVPEDEARKVVDDPEVGLREVKGKIQEQKSNGVDAVPYVLVEGRKRDFTLEGAREVDEYVKALENVIKESS